MLEMRLSSIRKHPDAFLFPGIPSITIPTQSELPTSPFLPEHLSIYFGLGMILLILNVDLQLRIRGTRLLSITPTKTTEVMKCPFSHYQQ